MSTCFGFKWNRNIYDSNEYLKKKLDFSDNRYECVMFCEFEDVLRTYNVYQWY